ncbi:MAG TPA: glutamine--fructose-6-phosphate transaminase (isomerizing) [Thermoleophilaceae bacterium]|nr:glutamine--fructose-6-phosphate transaminase (isomerizing) [Thermoleophilaceae bacterium]
MCGITGYVGSRPAEELLLAGLERLEYRGYDSAGIALLSDGALDKVRAVGNLEALRKRVARENRRSARSATIGIGHTRWATHGRVEERNAHPHSDHHGRFEVVLNGIVENFASLRTRLEGEGYRFNSDTDAEAVAHLISYHFEGDLPAAVGAACKELEGHYAFVVMCADEPDMLVAARRECPLVIGRGEGEQFLASDIPAFLGETRHVQYVDNDELVVVRPDGVEFIGHDGLPLDRAVKVIDWDPETAEKAGYDTFMLKEIHEQPQAVARTVGDRIVDGDISLSGLGEIDQRVLAEARRIVLIGCGTSYHAGLIGRYAIEEWSRVPTELDVASEYRYRNPVVGPDDLVVGLSQSGETADTLAALRLARERGAKVLGVTNVMGSQITRETDGVLYTRAGIEIGVAATKTYVAQVASMYLLAVQLAALHGTMPESRRSDLLGQLEAIPQQIDKLIADCDGPVRELAERYHRSEFFLYLGRHVGVPVALEGALKLKEIAYVPTDAYAAGEMKHGPIALLSEATPVICVATDSPVSDKVASNIQEVRARGAHAIALATEGNREIATYAEHVLELPQTDWMLQPLLAAIPLQLLAYHVARLRGLNVDQPRNLAKTVTVE